MSEKILQVLSDFRNATFQDKVYSGLSQLRSRNCFSFESLETSELRIFSQNGEDGVLYELVNLVNGPEHIVAIGSGDGWSSNSRLWTDVFGWPSLLVEADEQSYGELDRRFGSRPHVRTLKEFVTPSNINQILKDHSVPTQFGILDIDIDGADYWLWESLDEKWQPSIVVIEYNASFGEEEAVVEKYDHGINNLTENWGASIAALRKLGESKGYSLVYRELAGVNAFFVRSDLVTEQVKSQARTPNYGLRGFPHPEGVLYQNGPSERRPVVGV